MEEALSIGRLNRERLDKHEKTLEAISSDLAKVRSDLDVIRTAWDATQHAKDKLHSLLMSLLAVTLVGVFGFFGQLVLSARWAATTDALLASLERSQNRLENIVGDHEKRIRAEEVSPH